MTNLRCEPADCSIEALERRVLFVLYGPDISFGSGGHVTGVAANMELAELPDGKILAVGSVLHNSLEEFRTETWATRLNPNGTIDSSFANGTGRLDLSEGHSALFTGSRLYVIIPADTSWDVNEIFAYTPDGLLDTSFSADGRELVPSTHVFQSGDTITGRFLGPTDDGGVLMLSSVLSPLPGFEELVKLAPDGGVDETFGDGGFITFAEGAPETTGRWTSRGLILLESSNNAPGAELTRYERDGRTIDTSFGDAGTLQLPRYPSSLTEDADGKLLFIADPETASDPVTRRLHRLNPDGSPDTTFGDAGSVALDPAALFTNSGQILVDPQQRIVVASGGKLYRFDSTGDREFVVPKVETFGAGLFGIDSSGRVLRGFADPGMQLVTRFDELDPVAIGRDGVLYVHGDETDDVVAVEVGPPETIRVTRNGVVTDMPTNGIIGIDGITLRLGGGDNTVTASLDQPIVVDTGSGADTITTAAGDDTIRPGHGDNVVDVGGGNDLVEIPVTSDIGDTPGDDHHRITGGDGNKTINVSNGRATITLGVGNSKINATGGSSLSADDHITIAGGSNDVTMYGGDDVLEIGGNGNNKVSLDIGGTATITTGDGNDTFAASKPATINSNGGDDSIVLTLQSEDGPVLIFAGDGNDRIEPRDSAFYSPRATIHGGNGNDYVFGGSSGQTIYGGAGNDTLWGGAGSDLISAGGGNDRIYAGGGNDRVYGGNGRDRIYGGNHDDRLHGGMQGDWLYGQHGSNVLKGEGGNDRLYADYDGPGDGPDTLIGGTGDDLLVARDSLTDELFGGRGDDAALADEDDDLAGVESVIE